MKYIILELEGGKKVPIIFPEHLIHYDVADALIHYLNVRGLPICGGVVSAGFVSLDAISILPGESHSLNLGPAVGDELEIICNDWTNAKVKSGKIEGKYDA